MDRNAKAAFLLLASFFLLTGSLGCAGGLPYRSSNAIIRPSAPPEYDFLVGREFEEAGDYENAAEAYRRALAKDPESAVLQMKVSETEVRQGHYFEALEHGKAAHELSPDDNQIRVYLGSLFRIQRDAKQAEKYLLGEDGSPINMDAALLLGQLYLEVKRSEDSRVTAQWAIEKAPEVLASYFVLSAAYSQMNQHDEAEQALRQAFTQSPGDLLIYQQLLKQRRQTKGPEAQIEIYEEILEEYPHHFVTLRDLAAVFLSLERQADAREVLYEIEEFYPEDYKTTLTLAVIEYEAGHFEEAALRFERVIAANPVQYDFVYFLGLCRYELGEFDAAIEQFESIPASYDRFSDARIQLASVFEKQGDLERALENLIAARDQRPSRTLDYYIASLMTKVGDFEDAILLLERLIEETPEDDELLYNIGLVYGEAKRFDEALQYMFRALDENPDNWNALNYVGYAWAERGKNLDQAEAMILRALELRPEDGFITDSLGWVFYMKAIPLLEQGQVADAHNLVNRALETLKRAEKLTGGDSVISEHLGDAYFLLEDKKRAFEMYREAVELGPRSEEQPELMKKFESLQKELQNN